MLVTVHNCGVKGEDKDKDSCIPKETEKKEVTKCNC